MEPSSCLPSVPHVAPTLPAGDLSGVHARFRLGTPCVVQFGCPLQPGTPMHDLAQLVRATLNGSCDLPCLIADMSQGPREVEEARECVCTVSDFWRSRTSTMYLTELYMRHIIQRAGHSTRPYPAAVAGLVSIEDNWYQTEQPGRLESVFLGDAGTFGTLHRDTPLGWGWIFQISGSKRVLLFPPELLNAERALANAFDPSLRGHKAFATQLRPEDVNLMKQLGGQEAILREGDLLVIPSGWWHQTTNLEDDTLSCVDMVLEPWGMRELCTFEPDVYKHAVPDILREIVPYRTEAVAAIAKRHPLSPADRMRLWELMDGLIQLLHGVDHVHACVQPVDRAVFAGLHRQLGNALTLALEATCVQNRNFL